AAASRVPISRYRAYGRSVLLRIVSIFVSFAFVRRRSPVTAWIIRRRSRTVPTGHGHTTGVLKIGRSAVSDRQVVIWCLWCVPNVNTVSHASRDRVRCCATRVPQEGVSNGQPGS